MKRRSPLIAFATPIDLLEKIDHVAQQRFFSNRSAAIRWMLGCSLSTHEVVAELLAAERAAKETHDQ